MAIGTTAALIGASLAGSAISANAAKKATKAQTNAANNDIAFQKETRDIIRGDLSPYREGGMTGHQAYLYEMGLGEAPEGYGGWQQDPTYQFRLNQGMDALNASHAARSGIMSGAALQDAMQFNSDYAGSERANYLNRLAGLSDSGMAAAQMSGAASQNAAAGVSNALSNIGNAQAAGAIGVGNAFAGGLQNIAGIWNYQQNLNATPGYGGGR